MQFKKRIRLKLIVGFLVGVLSIGAFTVYSHYVLDNAKTTIDEQAKILKSTQLMTLHIKDSFNTLNVYLFTENSTELEALKSAYAVSSHNANKHLADLQEKEINLDLLEQLQNHSRENERLLQEMIYIHDFRLVEVDENELTRLENEEKTLLLSSKQTQEDVQGIFDFIIEDATSDFDSALLEYDRVRNNTTIFLFIIIAYSAGLAIIIANSLSKPISYLRDMASQIGKGNLDAEIQIKAKDELGELASEFNHMTRNLKKSGAAIRRKNKKLDESNKLKDMFADIMRHDILNPLTIIRGYARLITKKRKIKEAQLIAGGVDRTISIIDSAKKYALIKDSKLPKEDMDLKKIIDASCKQISPSYKEAKVRLINRVKMPLPIKANPLIGDVFLNFLTNALKYAPEGKKVIVEADKVKRSYAIKVIDFGQGVPDKFKKTIFNRFSRREREGVKGTGLGLAIVKKLVALHKGKVWVEDNPKGGSIFVVSLPVHQKR